MNRSLAYIFLLALALAPASDAGVFVQSPSEKPQAFAARALALPSDADQHVVAATWNGKKYLFVDYLEGENRQVVALEQIGDRQYRRIFVTTGEEEGGDADVAAIGFAPSKSANRDRLIVLLKWNVQHYDVSGTLYEVRIFDAAEPAKDKLAYLAVLSRHFDKDNCDCDRRGQKPEHFKFKTIAAIKAELQRIGS